MSKQKRVTGRGFDAFRQHVVNKGSQKYVANCKSCRFFDDACTNNNVTSFDVVTTEEGRTYCAYWQGYQPESAKNKKSEHDW